MNNSYATLAAASTAKHSHYSYMPRTISFGTDTDHFNMKSNLVEYLVIIFYRNRDNFF